MKASVWILGDQLTHENSALQTINAERDVVLMVESLSRARKLPYHKQKLILVWSAMRHFAGELTQQGYTVDYYAAQEDLDAALRTHLRRHQPDVIRLMDTAEYGQGARLARQVERLGCAARLTPNTLFLSDRDAFARVHRSGKPLVLEHFYRAMRKQTGLLLDENGQPVGGRWNFDEQNRQRLAATESLPAIPHYTPDATTQAVIADVAQRFPNHFGKLDGFGWPVTRAEALQFLGDFLERRLDRFGPYEDAMRAGERALYHSLLSPFLNIGLLHPLELCQRAEARFYAGLARLSSVEGFIRQIIGWREFVYQLYHLNMPTYLQSNHLEAELPLPACYWTAETQMACVRDAVQTLIASGLNHHIQRLMVTGNFALLAGIDPQAVNAWYHLAYIDAYEWVVTPNVLGLALYADGGVLASKPYAASAAYIHRMSNYCQQCAYDYRKTLSEQACPFNALYWDFLARHADRLASNPRMRLALANLARHQDIAATRAKAARIRDSLCAGDPI